MPQHKGKFANPLDQAAQTGIIGYVPEETPAPAPAGAAQVPENLSTQVPGFSGTQETRGLSSQGIRYSGTQETKNPGTQGIKGLGTQVPESRNAKSASSEYSRLGVYIRTDLHRRLKAHAALTGQEISDIATQAFLEYLARAEKRG